MRVERRLALAYLLVALGAAAIAMLAWVGRAQQPLLDRIDRLTLDTQMLWRGRLAPAAEPGLLLVSIDDASLQRLRSFVPDRGQLAQAIERLDAGGARLIVLDLLLLDPARPDPASDLVLAAAMRASGKVLIPIALPRDSEPSAPPAAYLLDQALMSHGGAEALLALQPSRLVAPIEPLARAARALGHVTVLRGGDGAVRFDLPALGFDGEVYPSLALRIAALAAGVDWPQVHMQFGEQLRLGERRIPVDERSRQWLNYYGPAGSFETVSFIDLLDGKVAPARLRGRIALVGVAAIGAGDSFASPFDAGLPGVERLATVVDNILSQRVLARPAWGAGPNSPRCWACRCWRWVCWPAGRSAGPWPAWACWPCC
ncbi:CHASE2 domain-containing protein [Paucibacter sp. O1-1]|nr:CHASE2 domain-containing protein [Paucibacter sp. O1-1]MDA3826784.1 CHASE2 domain-containing protein [Paucibacter sp. O1-1]